MTKFQIAIFNITGLGFCLGATLGLFIVSIVLGSIVGTIMGVVLAFITVNYLSKHVARAEVQWDREIPVKPVMPRILRRKPSDKKFSFDDAQTMYQNLVIAYENNPKDPKVLRDAVECANVLKPLFNKQKSRIIKETIEGYLVHTYQICGIDIDHFKPLEYRL